MSTLTRSREPASRPVIASIALGFVSLAATFLTALNSLWLQTFTLVSPSSTPWSFWASVAVALLSFGGMMGTLVWLDSEWGADA